MLQGSNDQSQKNQMSESSVELLKRQKNRTTKPQNTTEISNIIRKFGKQNEISPTKNKNSSIYLNLVFYFQRSKCCFKYSEI